MIRLRKKKTKMKVHGALFCLVDFQDMGVKLGLANQTIFDFLMGHIIIETEDIRDFYATS